MQSLLEDPNKIMSRYNNACNQLRPSPLDGRESHTLTNQLRRPKLIYTPHSNKLILVYVLESSPILDLSKTCDK